jgi:hypothetical protein
VKNKKSQDIYFLEISIEGSDLTDTFVVLAFSAFSFLSICFIPPTMSLIR